MSKKTVLALGLALQALCSGGIAHAGAPQHAQAAPAHAGVLGTPSQIAFEKQVLRVVKSPAMQAEIQRVEALYAADPQGATPTGKATIKRAAESIAAVAAQYAVGEDTDRPGVFWVVNAPHDWFGVQSPRSGYGIENPDNVYRNLMVDGAARYEIHGRVTQPAPAEQHFELRDSIPGTGAMGPEGGKQLATLSNDHLQIAADGTFTITLDSSPANGRANHMQMPSEGKLLLIVRDLFTDWQTQNPVALDVRRVGGPAIRPLRPDREVAQRAAVLLSQLAPYWLNYFNQYTYTGQPNRIKQVRLRPGGRGMSSGGYFDLKADEALVVTLDAVGAKSLGIQITDPWGVAYEYADRTSSLNNAQAKPNADGTYTFVISQKDPGVFNWLDPEGHSAGLFAIRWQSVPEGAKPETAVRDTAVVPLARLHEALPAGTRFVTPAERQAQQAERAASYARRLGD
jgi:hypothetical protein